MTDGGDRRGGDGMQRLLEIMARLRDPQQGCPWDLRQDWASLVPHTLEEAYEIAEAVRAGDVEELCAELGDLLFQVVFYARIAEEQALFDFTTVVEGAAEKIVRRHPHVFATADGTSLEALNRAWEAEKAREREARGHRGALAGVAHALPALTRAIKLQRRAARVGFDWSGVSQVLDKVTEELQEVRAELQDPTAVESQRVRHEVGDLLLAVSNLARHVDVDPEQALSEANRRFESRFAAMERLSAAAGETFASLPTTAKEALWEQAKQLENKEK